MVKDDRVYSWNKVMHVHSLITRKLKKQKKAVNSNLHTRKKLQNIPYANMPTYKKQQKTRILIDCGFWT